MKNKKRKTIRNSILILSLFAVLIIGTAYALLMTSEEDTGTFTVGNIKIEVSDTLWKTGAFKKTNGNGQAILDSFGNEIYVHKSMGPCDQYAKNPIITNIGDNDAFVYMSITVPLVTINEVQTELFTYNVNPEWIEFNTDDSNNQYVIHYYYYNAVLPIKSSTTSLLKNNIIQIIDNDEPFITPNDEISAQINGFACQCEYGKEFTIADAWSVLANKNHSLPTTFQIS